MTFPTPPPAGIVICVEIGLLSDDVPLTTMSRFAPAPVIVTVCFLGPAPILYLDLAGSSFHVPVIGSAAINAPAIASSANMNFVYFIVSPIGSVQYTRLGSITPTARPALVKFRGVWYGSPFETRKVHGLVNTSSGNFIKNKRVRSCEPAMRSDSKGA